MPLMTEQATALCLFPMIAGCFDLMSSVNAENCIHETDVWATAGVSQAVLEWGIHVRQLLVAAAGARMGDAGV